MKISKQKLLQIIKEEVSEIAVKRDKEGKMAKFDAKEAYEDAIDVFKMIDEYDDLPEWLEAKITKASDYLNSVKDYLQHHHSGNNEGNIEEAGPWSHEKHIDLMGSSYGKSKGKGSKGNKNFYQGYSSKEAKNIIDKGLKLWAKDLRKVQYRVIKDWMSKAKSGVIDYFDLVRGLKTGDVRRAHGYETDFLFKLLNKDKIMDRFRKYFGGKKGKKGRRK